MIFVAIVGKTWIRVEQESEVYVYVQAVGEVGLWTMVMIMILNLKV